MAQRCNRNSCTHYEWQHPDPNTCGGSKKCTTEVCECEKFTPA